MASFSVSPTTVCIGDNVQLTNTSTTPADSIDTWHYYGDGGYYVSSCSDAQNVTSPFTHATGSQNISMVACYRGCCDSTAAQQITVNGPLATFSVAMDCNSPYLFNFAADTGDASYWTWNFGDSDSIPNSTAINISHTYTATGDYNVILTAYNPSHPTCKNSVDTVKVHVRDIKANFTYDSLLCSKTPHNFDASISTGVYADPHNGYIWIWGDGTHLDITGSSAISHTFSASGRDTVTLIVKDINGCADTITKIVRAFSATASFTVNPVMCANSIVTFTNTSTSDTSISNSTGYIWHFGDGSTSTQQNPTHTYSVSNTSITSVTVTLFATDTLGCVDSTKKTISISRPSAVFHPTSSIAICAGSTVNFLSSNSYPNMTWSYGDGTTLGPTPPTTTTSHSYTTSGNYTITLTVMDAAGCTDIKSYNQPINVQNVPQVYITSPAFNNSNLCYPYQAHFTDSSVVNIFASRGWNLHNGTPTNNNLDSVGLLCPLPGTYSVTLTETTTNGCKDSITKTIKVNGPLADFSVSPDTICKGQSITFTIKDTSDVDTWHWDFGDGKDTTGKSPISHTYNVHPPNVNGTTNVQLIYWSKDSTCAQSIPHQISIRQVIAAFNRNHVPESLIDTAHCIGVRDTFLNNSTGASTYGWNYGDGSATNTTVFSPAHTYTVAGTYNVELYIKDNVAGCVDTLIKKMIIYPLFSVTATGDTICQGKTAQLNASAANTYSWTAQTGVGLSSAVIANPTTSPSVTATYTLMASDANGCKDSVNNVVVYVIQAPDTVEDVHTIVIGQTYTLPGSQVTAGFTYTWSPTANLSCTNCPMPVFSGTVDAHYVETIADTRGCFSAHSTFDIKVEPLASVDVPTAFTPNGDGTNDIVYVAGWGIKSLQYFKIYNRWGELVFESNDINVGWDGTYRGTPQNIETYVYQVSATSYISQEPITKKGYIKLLR